MTYGLSDQFIHYLVRFLAEFNSSAFLKPRHPAVESVNTLSSVDSLTSDEAKGGGVLGVDSLKL